jgi:hypothetical protein
MERQGFPGNLYRKPDEAGGVIPQDPEISL